MLQENNIVNIMKNNLLYIILILIPTYVLSIETPTHAEKIKKESSSVQFTEKDYIDFIDFVKNNNVSGVLRFLARGMDPNSDDTIWNDPALVVASSYGHTTIMNILLDKGADINIITPKSRSPLETSVDQQQLDATELLLKRGANPNIEGKYFTPLMRAALMFDSIPFMNKLIQYGADIDKKDSHNRTALIYAAIGGKTENIQFLIDNGAYLHAKDGSGFNSVMYAAWGCHTSALQFLVETGAKINERNKDGWNSLFFAVDTGCIPTVKYLIEHKAEINIHASDNSTPLTDAVVRGNLEMTRLLIENGAKINEICEHNKTPLTLAKEKGHKDIVELLTKLGGIE